MRDTLPQARYTRAHSGNPMETLPLPNQREPVSFPSLRDLVVQRVRSDIITGRSAPGAMYSVPVLAEELGVSTTPAREALLELSRAGLIAPMRNRGFKVESVSLGELNNLFAVRELLECFAAASLAASLTLEPDQLRQLADNVAAAVEGGDVLTYVEADRAFHRTLVVQAGNPLLAKLIMELRDGMRLYGIDSLGGKQRQIASVREHYRMIEMAEAGDKDGIAALMSRHILDWKPVFTQALTDHPAGRSTPVGARFRR